MSVCGWLERDYLLHSKLTAWLWKHLKVTIDSISEYISIFHSNNNKKFIFVPSNNLTYDLPFGQVLLNI